MKKLCSLRDKYISVTNIFYLNRFVRFVSTPEILERVYTIETAILQIDEAIAMQSSNDMEQSIVND